MQKDTKSKFAEVKDYRKLTNVNYTACKDFDESRYKFYKKYVLQQAIEEEKSAASVYGDLVHCLLLNPDDFDMKFARIGSGITPKPQMKAFADNLWEATKKAMSESGEVTTSMEHLMEEAFNATAFSPLGERIAFKGKALADVVERFPKEAEAYYNYKRENFGKDIISEAQYTRAERCVEELQVNPVTKHIFEIRDGKDYTILNEVPIAFEYEGHQVKALCDKIVISHAEKKVYLYDLKSSGWDIGTFDYNIIKNRYYLQWAMYHKAVEWFMKSEFKDYAIVPMQFIVVSTDMSENPLIYTTSMRDVYHGLHGFTRNGRVHKGLNQILTEIAWHNAYGIWNMSYTDYQNKGIRKVSLFEEK
jgi:hypothetical protein